jgi:LCP family protein required for cell wall assembly
VTRPGSAATRSHRRRPLRTLGIVVLAVAIAGVLTGASLTLRADDALDRVDITTRVGRAERPPTAEAPEVQAASEQVDRLDGALDVLLVGSDDRAVLSPEERAELGTGEAEGERTETMILMRIDPAVEGVAALSLPRDLLVSRCDGSRGRLNAAYSIGERSGTGGAACLVETVTALTGVEPHHFVKVDFRGFLDIVDTLGGVTLHLEEPLSDDKAFLDLPAGCVTLDSADALAFVRARGIDSDYGRIARQHRFLTELAADATSVGSLANVPRLFSLVDTIARSLEVDDDLSLGRMRRIAATGRDLPADALISYTVPATPRRINGTEFLILDEQEAQPLFAAFANGTILDDPSGADARHAEGGGPEPEGQRPDEPHATSPDAAGEPSGSGVEQSPAAETPAPTPMDASRFAGAASDVDC